MQSKKKYKCEKGAIIILIIVIIIIIITIVNHTSMSKKQPFQNRNRKKDMEHVGKEMHSISIFPPLPPPLSIEEIQRQRTIKTTKTGKEGKWASSDNLIISHPLLHDLAIKKIFR